MEVSPWISRLFCSVILLGLLGLAGCGNRFDLATERGRRARIDDANFHLSKGECAAALEAISYLYNSPHVDEEVRLVTSSAYACSGTFNMLNMVANLSGATNFFSVMAKVLSNTAGDGARTSFYNATDVLTQNGALLNGSQRTTTVNNYMVFLQMGLIGSILRNYGNPDSAGAQVSDLIYVTADNLNPNEMSDLDACALAAGLSTLVDSYNFSSLSDSTTSGAITSLDSVCIAAGLSGCDAISRNRNGCDGTNPQSVVAESVVTGVNTSW